MLKSFRSYLLLVILSLVFTNVSVNHAYSQPPPPPPGGTPGSGGHNLNVNQGGAPVGEGIWILLTLAFSYGLHSYMRRRENVGDETLQDKLVTAETNNSVWETHDSGLKAFINHTLRHFFTRIFHYYKS